MLNRLREWVERFTADEPTPEEIMEIRAREGTLLDDLREAKEGVAEFLHELTEADEDDYIYAYYDNSRLDEIIEANEELMKYFENIDIENQIITGKQPEISGAISILADD